jgi:hypothetical protein
MWWNRAEIEPGSGAHFYRGSGNLKKVCGGIGPKSNPGPELFTAALENGRILGALLGVPPIPTQG